MVFYLCTAARSWLQLSTVQLRKAVNYSEQRVVSVRAQTTKHDIQHKACSQITVILTGRIGSSVGWISFFQIF